VHGGAQCGCAYAPYPPDAISWQYKRMAARLKSPVNIHIHIHALRHFSATDLFGLTRAGPPASVGPDTVLGKISPSGEELVELGWSRSRRGPGAQHRHRGGGVGPPRGVSECGADEQHRRQHAAKGVARAIRIDRRYRETVDPFDRSALHLEATLRTVAHHDCRRRTQTAGERGGSLVQILGTSQAARLACVRTENVHLR